VVAVSIVCCAVVVLNVSEVGERLHVVGLVAPEGEVVTAQLSVTDPVNELPGVTVMVEVLPVAAPGATVMLPLLARVKLVLPPPGACQKSPQPARKPASTGAAANNNRADLPIFITTPFLIAFKYVPLARLTALSVLFKGIASARILSWCRLGRARSFAI
jgi:hypothetical protein